MKSLSLFSRLSIRKKVGVSLLGVVLLYTALDAIVDRFSVLPSFESLEREEAQRDIQRCTKALAREVHHLDLAAGDWAGWDDTYEFAADRNEEYIRANLVETTFTTNRLTLVAIFDSSGQLIWGQAHYPDGDGLVSIGSLLPVPLPQEYRINSSNPDDRRAGLLVTSRGPMLVSFRPILTSEDKGPSRGTFVFGRLVTERLLDSLQDQTEVAFHATSVAELSEEQLQILSAIQRNEGLYVESASDDFLNVYSEVKDIWGNPGLILKAEVPRLFSTKGKASLRSALLSTLGAGLVSVLFLMVFLGKTVVFPLSTLTRQVVEIGSANDLSRRVSMKRGDEIGALAREFNTLLDRLENDLGERDKMNAAMKDSERLAAIGQMSASVAHEIRNPLTGISSAVQVLNKSIAEDDPRKDVFRDILQQVDRVDGTVRSLLMFAKPWTPEKCRCDLNELVEASCREVEDLEEFASVRLVLEVEANIDAFVDKRLCQYVLTNLLRNAAHAMPEGGELRLRAFQQDDRLRIVVTDTGDGIPPEVECRVFEPFFTTKTRGTGLGLAVCKQIVEAHGGAIQLTSVLGQGTEITIDLPLGA